MYYFVSWNIDKEKVSVKKFDSLIDAEHEAERIIYTNKNWMIVVYDKNDNPVIIADNYKKTRDLKFDIGCIIVLMFIVSIFIACFILGVF